MAHAAPAVGRLERRKARTVAAILDAAERHFLERGYEATKVDEIAADADVAVGSLYNHFGSKDGLYAALLEHALETFEAYMSEEAPADLTPLERILDVMGHLARFGRERPGEMRVLCLPQPNAPRAKYRVGDRVVTRVSHPRGHTRMPRYVRGKHGVIERFHGVETLPDANAHGRGR